MDTHFLANKDVLNFDGPKFIFVLGRIVALFSKAMKEAGLPEETRNNVMRQYRDLIERRGAVGAPGSPGDGPRPQKEVTCLSAGIR